MKAKLIKVNNIYTLMDGDKMVASSDSDFQTDYEVMKLSKQNCDEIFGVVDVERLANETFTETNPSLKEYEEGLHIGFKEGFLKAMELNKDKLFIVEDIRKAFNAGWVQRHNEEGSHYENIKTLIQSLQQPTEIEVEVEMVCPHPSDTYKCGLEFGCDEDGCNNPNQIPYLDENGCLILKKL